MWKIGLGSHSSFITLAFPIVMKYTQTTLDKLQSIPEQAGYILRYERGNFQSGYCILESKKVIVLNKFPQIEGRINTLLELIPQLAIDPLHLPEDLRKLYEAARSQAAPNPAV
ncbi:MAG: hypothetical protein FJX92_04850 [Bacteroidetes bacterium]|nr:hypothetical protein [Bacteroidota bacterium]